VEAERRQLTIMFCDLVGSTPLSTRFDPEDLREIVGAYHRCVTDTVARFGGFVAKYMGDGVLVYFGYPEAHEDDAERAAQRPRCPAGPAPADGRRDLASRRRHRAPAPRPPRSDRRRRRGQWRCRSARSAALAWRARRGPRTQCFKAAGDPALAEHTPGRLWLSETGERLGAEILDFEQGADLSAGAVGTLVGRDEELDLLLRRWQQAKSGEGRVAPASRGLANRG
jgi:hypothetical protein